MTSIKSSHCGRGHRMSGANIYLRSNGKRQCRKCAIERARAYYRKKKESRDESLPDNPRS